MSSDTLSTSRGRVSAFLFLAGLAAIVPGCSSGDVPVVPVQGTVTLDGKPLAGAEVVFSPEVGRPSLGVTDSQGRYELRYLVDRNGALPGKHTVKISTLGDGESDDSDKPARKRELVPKKYNRQSTLTVDVDASRQEAYDFELLTK